MSYWFFLYLLALWHQPVYQGEAYYVPAQVAPPAAVQVYLPPQEHFCRVISPTLSVCA